MKVYTNFAQNSLEWLSARAGVITASEIDSLVSPKWEVRKGKGVETYLAQKVAEKWIGGPIAGAMTLDMEFGHILEQECLPWLSLLFDWKIDRPSFITTDDGVCGCSPDGFVEEGQFGIEIKSPQPQNHVKYLLSQTVPDDYVAQIQFSMFVSGAQEWRFVSYRRGFPKLILNVVRDDEAQEAIADALAGFLPRLEDAMDKLTILNGGKRPAPNAFREAVLKQQPEPKPEIVDYRH